MKLRIPTRFAILGLVSALGLYYTLRYALGYVHTISADDATRYSLVIATALGIIAIVVAVGIPLWQSAGQRANDEADRTLQVCANLRNHLTEWHDALRKAVINNKRDGIRDLQQAMEDLRDFQGAVRFQGPLGDWLQQLRAISGSERAVAAVSDFQETVLDVKKGQLSALHDLLYKHEGVAISFEARCELDQEKRARLAVVSKAYWIAVEALDELSASIRRGK